MGAKGEPLLPIHAVVLSDVPETASTVDRATNKRIINYLNNIDETGPVGGPYNQVLRRSQTKRREKIGRSAIRHW